MGRKDTSGLQYNPTWGALLKAESTGGFFPRGRSVSFGGLCAEMSRLAYCEEAKVRSVLPKVGFQIIELDRDKGFFNNNGTQAFLAKSDEAVVLAFRGTEGDDPTDIITDAKFLLEPWQVDGQQVGRVHRGFSEALEYVWAGIVSKLEALDDLPLLLTGHSLGAALATLAVSLVKSATLYTYGSPRVGDADFCSAAMGGVDAHRYVNCCDLVCKVPPEALAYAHYGQLNYIDRSGNVSTTKSQVEMEEDQFAARKEYLLEHAWRLGNVLTRDLADHAPINYVSALK